MTSPAHTRRVSASEHPVDYASSQQSVAANPLHSAWVEASAGSGKTKVLIDRVLRLLLAGVAPHRILCLTFTKAAAAEMAVRLTGKLGSWATKTDADLARELLSLTNSHPDDEQIGFARRLFAATLDAPGGLQFQTIHSFCQSLLARFPLEAGVPVGFKVIEERQCRELLETARRSTLQQASLQPHSELAQAVTVLLEEFGDQFADLESEIIDQSGTLEAQLQNGPGLALARLAPLLEIEEGETSESVHQRFCSDDWHDMPGLRNLAQLMIDDGGKTNSEMGTLLAGWLARDVSGRVIGIADFIKVFRTGEGEPRANVCTKKLAEANPQLMDIIIHEQEVINRLMEKRKALATLRSSRAAIIYASSLLQRYHQLKVSMTALDFGDLIRKAAALVTRENAPWVLFKLDGGIEHVLVDEAQDTNERQWQLIDALTTDFFSGEGQKEHAPTRTVFAVGDYKQSIYSFQGANPDAFRSARDAFARRIARMGNELKLINFNISFRSTTAVLSAVDRVFRTTDAQHGLPDYLEHASSQPHLPGKVDVWPVAPADAKDSKERTPPVVKMANVLAGYIRHAVESQQLIPTRGRPAQYGDYLVLVRSRGAFMPEFVRACKQLGVPVSGADRMVIDDQLAVEDLLAFANFLLLPEDDLTLATVLKGPFIGMSEEALFALAHDRSGTLLSELGKADKATAAWLALWQRKTDRITPYTLLSSLLAEPCPQDERSGRRAIISRLGPEANDPLDELLALALQYEQGEVPSLQGFMRWIKMGQTEIKRQMEQATGQVRIMTVHGSKGLQAPVVIVADSLSPPTDKQRLLPDPDGIEPPLLAGSRKNEAPVASARRERMQRARLDEYHRLLYVALTRAEDELIFAGWSRSNLKLDADGQPVNDPKTPGWYHHLLQGLGASEDVDFNFAPYSPLGWQGRGLRLVAGDAAHSRDEKKPAAQVALKPAKLDEWALRLPPEEPSPSKPLTPSKLEDDTAALSPLADREGWRFRRGLLIHRLLQTLPDLPPAQRRSAGLSWLGKQADNPQQLIDEVMAVLEHKDYAALFGPNSRAEVPVSGRVGHNGQLVLSGQIDRLAIEAGTVWLVDYKTIRQPPAAPEAVDKAYIKQLAAYRAALTPLYPEHEIRAILLWTDGPLLMEIPDSLLNLHAP